MGSKNPQRLAAGFGLGLTDEFLAAFRAADTQLAAKNIFEKYEMCSKIYSRQWQQGKSIEQLTVAG